MIWKRGDVLISFIKMSGTGNDFVVVDNRAGIITDREGFTKTVCPRRTAIGADGTLLLEESEKADVRMRYLNSDGGEVEMCGNGARCISHFAHSLGLPERFTLETMAGVLPVEVNGDFVRVVMPDSFVDDDVVELDSEFGHLKLYHANTGVPHRVMFFDDLEELDIRGIGAFVRYHQQFNPPGTNMNFIRVTGRNSLDIRTYERGVEDETLACGTGATAAALIAGKLGLVESPCTVSVRLPGELTIEWGKDRVYLSGDVDVCFTGEVEYP